MAFPPYFLAIGFLGLLGLGIVYYQQKKVFEKGRCYSNIEPGFDTRTDLNYVSIDSCSICLEELKSSIKVLPCRHKLHEKCYQELIKTDKRCPECRKSIQALYA